MFWGDILKELTKPYFIVAVYGIFILWTFLIYTLIHGVYKKILHKNYGYAYLAFLPIFIIFFFGYYTNYDKGKFIPESTFETRLQNIEIKENGLIQLGKIFEKNKEAEVTLYELDKKIGNTYRCITGNRFKKCEDSDFENSFNLYKLEHNDIKLLNNEFSKVVKYKYFKQDITTDKYISLQGLTTLSRTSLFSVIYQLEEGNINKAINILLIYKNLGDKLLEGDSSIIGMIVGSTIGGISNNNINYVLNNYELKTKNLNILKNELRNIYDSEEILFNAIKMEYWFNKYGLDKGFDNGFRTSMLLNREDFLNENRNAWLDILDGKDYFAKNNNYFKRNYFYRFIGGVSRLSGSNYKKYIEKINIERKKILEKIELKLEN